MKPIDEIKQETLIKIDRIGEDGCCGFFKTRGFFIFSWGAGWEHLSISFENRCPTWEEMCQAKDIFFKKDECCVQYHPAEKDYVNFHPYCLHIWRPINKELPIPHSIMIGPQKKVVG